MRSGAISSLIAVALVVACERKPATPSANAVVDDTTVHTCKLTYSCGLSHPGLGTSSQTWAVDFTTCTKTVSSESGPFEVPARPPGASDASTSTSSSSTIPSSECTHLQKLATEITDEDAKREQEAAQIDTAACMLTLACPSDPAAHPKLSVQRQSLTGGGPVTKLIVAVRK